jgi:BASS family bile acid:Na+ symporter
MKKSYHNYFLIGSLVFLLGSGGAYLAGKITLTGILLIMFCISLATGVRGFEKYKGYSYTLWIFASVAAAMFFPNYFIQIGNFQVKATMVPLLQIIMFGMGSQLSFDDFAGVIKMPRGVIVGVICQFSIMPFVGYLIAKAVNFPPEIAAGIILIGCVPSGLASNVMSFLARANLALAVTIGAIATLLSPLLTPVLMKWLGGQYVEVNFWSMMLDILNMIIFPIVAGFIFNLFLKRDTTRKSMIIQLLSYMFIILATTLIFIKVNDGGVREYFIQFAKTMGWFYFLPMAGALVFRQYLKGNTKLMESLLSFISMVGIALIICIIVASGRDNLLKVGGLLILTSLVHNVAGYGLGYTISWLTGLPERDRRTVAFEVGMQNGGLASGLALLMGKVATVGLAPAIFGSLMNITGSILANFWRERPPVEAEVKS